MGHRHVTHVDEGGVEIVERIAEDYLAHEDGGALRVLLGERRPEHHRRAEHGRVKRRGLRLERRPQSLLLLHLDTSG